MVLSFLEVLASSSLTISIAFFVFFVLFLLVSIAALICFEVMRASDAWSAPDKSRTLSPDNLWEQQRGEALNLGEQRGAIRAILTVSVISLLFSAVSIVTRPIARDRYHQL
jgi:hypothetical protein